MEKIISTEATTPRPNEQIDEFNKPLGINDDIELSDEALDRVAAGSKAEPRLFNTDQFEKQTGIIRDA